jgi:hypothetical protein
VNLSGAAQVVRMSSIAIFERWLRSIVPAKSSSSLK